MGSSPDDSVVDPTGVRVCLADVPFVPLRNRFRELEDLPGSFAGLRREFGRQLDRDAERPALVEIAYRSPAEGVLSVDGRRLRVRPKALAILHFLLERQRAGVVYPGQIEAAEAFPEWAAARGGDLAALEVDADVFRHELSHLRTRLRQDRCGWLPPVRSLDFPPFELRVEE